MLYEPTPQVRRRRGTLTAQQRALANFLLLACFIADIVYFIKSFLSLRRMLRNFGQGYPIYNAAYDDWAGQSFVEEILPLILFAVLFILLRILWRLAQRPLWNPQARGK